MWWLHARAAVGSSAATKGTSGSIPSFFEQSGGRSEEDDAGERRAAPLFRAHADPALSQKQREGLEPNEEKVAESPLLPRRLLPHKHPRLVTPKLASAASSTRHPLAHVDLYAYLAVPRTASTSEVKAAYRRLIRQRHPDRLGGGAAGAEAGTQALEEAKGTGAGAAEGQAGADELNAAWEVLGDEEQRRAYDAARAAFLAARSSSSSAFALSLSLDLFEPHYPPGVSPDTDEGAEPALYTHPCRCSSEYRISLDELEAGIEVIVCEGCSERCRVEYEVVEE